MSCLFRAARPRTPLLDTPRRAFSGRAAFRLDLLRLLPEATAELSMTGVTRAKKRDETVERKCAEARRQLSAREHPSRNKVLANYDPNIPFPPSSTQPRREGVECSLTLFLPPSERTTTKKKIVEIFRNKTKYKNTTAVNHAHVAEKEDPGRNSLRI